MRQLLIATGNPHKLAEMTAFLCGLPLEVRGLDVAANLVLPTETGTTYAENAIIKADAVATATGAPALADDSGIEVDALDGGPGVYSARYAGEGATSQANNQRLLEQLQGIPPERRGASFVCVLALVWPGLNGGRRVRLFEGRCRGVVTAAAAGQDGFGYDPLFLYPPLGLTMAQLGDHKHQVSHRALAFGGLHAHLRRLLQSMS